MPFVALLLALQPVPLETLVERWRDDDPHVRSRASDQVRDRWKDWTADDLARLDRATGDSDAEVAARAREGLERVLVCRRLGEIVLGQIKDADRILLTGRTEEKAKLFRVVRLLLDGGLLKAEDLAGLEALAREAKFDYTRALTDIIERQDFDAFAGAFLKSPRADLRARAVERVAERGREGVGDVAPLLEDDAAPVRAAALRAVRRWDARELAPKVALRLGDPRVSIRREALALLVGWKVETDVAPLLKDADWLMRLKAVEVLASSGRKDAAALLAPALKDAHAPTRAEAAAALGELGARERAPELAALLGDADPGVRRNAAFALGKLGATEFGPKLVGLLEDPDDWVRMSAAQALGMQGDGRSGRALLASLGSADPLVRADTVWALGRVATRELSLDLLALLDGADEALRHDTVWVLERLEAREHADRVALRLQDASGWVRSRAARAVGRLGEAAHAAPLAALLRDPDRRARIFAALGLGELGARVPLPDETLRALADREGDADRVSGLAASIALIRVGRRDRAGQRARLAELRADEVAAPFLGADMLEALNRSNERASWEGLDRPLLLDRAVETWSDLQEALRLAGFRVETEQSPQLGRMERGSTTTARGLIQWMLGPRDPPRVVLEGRTVRLLERRAALDHWQKRLDAK